jgi:hypothetical protein
MITNVEERGGGQGNSGITIGGYSPLGGGGAFTVAQLFTNRNTLSINKKDHDRLFIFLSFGKLGSSPQNSIIAIHLRAAILFFHQTNIPTLISYGL